MRLYLARHGQTDWNYQKRMQGRVDTALNETGIAQAHELKEKLKGISFDAIYVSPLSRAVNTAKIASGRDDVIIDERIIEMDYGSLQGKTYKPFLGQEADASDEEQENMKNYFFAPQNYKAPKDGETYEQVIARTEDFINDILSRHEAAANVLVVAHAAILHAILLNYHKLPLERYWEIPVNNAEYVVLDF